MTDMKWQGAQKEIAEKMQVSYQMTGGRTQSRQIMAVIYVLTWLLLRVKALENFNDMRR